MEKSKGGRRAKPEDGIRDALNTGSASPLGRQLHSRGFHHSRQFAPIVFAICRSTASPSTQDLRNGAEWRPRQEKFTQVKHPGDKNNAYSSQENNAYSSQENNAYSRQESLTQVKKKSSSGSGKLTVAKKKKSTRTAAVAPGTHRPIANPRWATTPASSSRVPPRVVRPGLTMKEWESEERFELEMEKQRWEEKSRGLFSKLTD